MAALILPHLQAQSSIGEGKWLPRMLVFSGGGLFWWAALKDPAPYLHMVLWPSHQLLRLYAGCDFLETLCSPILMKNPRLTVRFTEACLNAFCALSIFVACNM